MVEEAQQQKAPTQRFVDVFAKYYTPIVMILALLVGLVPPLLFGAAWMDWIYRALVLARHRLSLRSRDLYTG